MKGISFVYCVLGMPVRASDFSMSSINLKSMSKVLESSTSKRKMHNSVIQGRVFQEELFWQVVNYNTFFSYSVHIFDYFHFTYPSPRDFKGDIYMILDPYKVS